MRKPAVIRPSSPRRAVICTFGGAVRPPLPASPRADPAGGSAPRGRSCGHRTNIRRPRRTEEDVALLRAALHPRPIVPMDAAIGRDEQLHFGWLLRRIGRCVAPGKGWKTASAARRSAAAGQAKPVVRPGRPPPRLKPAVKTPSTSSYLRRAAEPKSHRQHPVWTESDVAVAPLDRK